MKVFFYTEDLSEPFDEGIKKTAYNIILELNKQHKVISVAKWYSEQSYERSAIRQVSTNRLLLNLLLRMIIRDFAPDAIIYLPSSSGTFASFVRMKVLSRYYKNAKSVMINLQPKNFNFIQKNIIKLLKPNIVLTPSPQVLEQLPLIGIKVEFLPLYVDTKKFKPIQSEDKKIELRKKYQIPIDRFVITHIGHINWGRNLESLIPLQTDENQVVIIGSSSTPIDAPKEEKLKQFLIESGIIIIDRYIENIKEIYQLSDLYIFPVVFEGGCIGIPLSILEARACGIPVLTTDFGGIKKVFGIKENGIFYSECGNFANRAEEIKNNMKRDLTLNNIEQINEEFFRRLNDAVCL